MKIISTMKSSIIASILLPIIFNIIALVFRSEENIINVQGKPKINVDINSRVPLISMHNNYRTEQHKENMILLFTNILIKK